MEIQQPKNINLKYFSHLDSNQKKRTINYLRIFRNNLQELPYKKAVENLKKNVEETNLIKRELKAQKVFRDKTIKAYFPLNYNEIINQ